jgi:nitroimidazol reductase NimA-like FMN-containing flavoprotein (pyridoxamine 5'-phosphate oxidase superfamily)
VGVMDDAPAKRAAGTIHALSKDECLELLSTTTVGRLAFVGQDGPELVPVNFAVIDDHIYFRTLPDGFLSGLRNGTHPVAFGVDHHDDTFQRGWNVTVKGTIRQVEDRATINKVLSHERLRPWAGGVRPMVMRIDIVSVDGRRVAAPRRG